MRGSIATAIADLARVRRHAASTSFSARYWMVASIVSMMPCPATEGLSTIGRAGDLAAERVALHHRAPLDAGQVRVPRLLDPGEALALGALEAHELGGQLAVRVEAQAVLHQGRATDP